MASRRTGGMPLIKLTNQQIILVLGSNGYRNQAGKRPLGALLPFVVGAGLALFLSRVLGSSVSKPAKPSGSSRRAR